MQRVRVIKRKDGVVQTQHRFDGRYDASTLPVGTSSADIAAELVVDASELADVEDLQAQVDVAGGRLVKSLSRKPLQKELEDRRAAAEVLLGGLEADTAVPEPIKRYLVALRDHLNAGPDRIAHPQPPATGRR